MKITAENDNGPYETIFSVFSGYNIKLILVKDKQELEAQITGFTKTGLEVKLFATDKEEDEPTGPKVHYLFDDIEEIVVH